MMPFSKHLITLNKALSLSGVIVLSHQSSSLMYALLWAEEEKKSILPALH